jgi:hypothetical protein
MNKVSTSLLPATAAVFFLAISGFALAADTKADTPPQTQTAKVVEYFCCENNDKGICLPATKSSKCPAGTTTVVNETCEKGERGCNL